MEQSLVKKFNEYSLLCVQFLEGKIVRLRLVSRKRVLGLTDEQANSIMKQAKNLMGLKK